MLCYMPGAGDISVNKIGQKFMLYVGVVRRINNKISKTNTAERQGRVGAVEQSRCCFVQVVGEAYWRW